MKVLLLNIDSKLPNIALKKVEMWHELRGDEVVWDMPMLLTGADKAYASCIFTKNKGIVDNYKGLNPELITGGTGYDLTVKLPAEIDRLHPLLNYGFTTRGCIRKCPFCIVPKAEGGITVVGDIFDIWDGESKSITLLDNNILAVPDHFKVICRQLIQRNLKVDFNQALDIRLVDEESAWFIAEIKHSRQISFSFDYVSIEKQFRKGMRYLQKAGIRMSRVMIFLLVGFNTTLEEDLGRIEMIKSYGASPFVMKYRVVNDVSPLVTREEDELRELARWINQPHGFYKVMSFEEFKAS